MALEKGRYMFLICTSGKPVLKYYVRKNSVYGAVDAFGRWFEKSRLLSLAYSVSCYRNDSRGRDKDIVCWKQEFPQLIKQNRA